MVEENTSGPTFTVNNRTSRTVTWYFAGFWLLVAVLDTLQDVLATCVQHSPFIAWESLSFKTFWFLFIPLTWVLARSFGWFWPGPRKLVSLAPVTIYGAALGLLHLLLFTIILYTLSHWFLYRPWRFDWLWVQKISTRFYLVLAVYVPLALVMWRRSTTPGATGPPLDLPDQDALLTVRQGRQTTRIPVKRIRFIQVEHGCTVLYTVERKYVLPDTLKDLGAQLNPREFFRIHRSAIVGLKQIHQLQSRLNGDYDVLLQKGEVLRMSRRYALPVKAALGL